MASLNVGNLGEYLREQRRTAQLSLRQLADAAGVSNPYLSQIERGLRKPSAEVLQQVAKALRISAETLYVRAGILDAERDGDEDRRDGATRAAILADPTLNERQKQVLLQVYEALRKENGFEHGHEDGLGGGPGSGFAAARPGAERDGGPRDRGGDGGDLGESGGPSEPSGTRDGDGVRGRDDSAVRHPRTADGGDADPRQRSAG
ncbi:helix-turn-helix domain-containing protein [Streptomyces cinereospinus]|uniref:Helix-turn-helix domain-containing protein n=1 Tax=Streptomyces cinereospinus TaxID=285561 RepID=A0ABV5N3Q8_9ACTN